MGQELALDRTSSYFAESICSKFAYIWIVQMHQPAIIFVLYHLYFFKSPLQLLFYDME